MKRILQLHSNDPCQYFGEGYLARIKAWMAIVGMVALLLCTPFLVFAQAETVEKKKGPPLPMHHLSNEDLLKEAEGIFNQAADKYLASLRGLAKSKFLFTTAQRATQVFSFSEKITITRQTPPLEAAKIEAEQAKVRLDEFKHQLELLEAEKISLDQYTEHIEPAQSAAKSFAVALDDLNLFVFEIRLRVNDRTLSAGDIPDVLNETTLIVERSRLRTQQQNLTREATGAAEQQKEMTQRIKKSKERLIEFETLLASADKKYSQELSRQSVEQDYLQKSPEQLLFELSELEEELIWLNEVFNRSAGRFNEKEKQTAELQKKIEQLKPPETKDIFEKTAVRPEEMEQVVKKVEEVMNYHTGLVQQLRDLRFELRSLISQSEVFQGDGTVLSSHFFRMQVIAKILEDFAKQRKIKLEQISQDSRTEALIAANDKIDKQVSEALSIAGKAQERINQIAKEIHESESTQTDIEERLQQMKKTAEAAQQAQEWNAILKDLTAKQIVERFEQNAEKMQTNQENLQKAKEAYQQGQALATEAWKKFDSLKDPLLLSAQEEFLTEKQNIVKKLYQMADLEIPAEAKKQPLAASEEAPAPEKKDTAELEKKKYQNLISTRIRIIDEREKAREELLKILKDLNEKLETYVAALNEANKLALQHYANALELKKRTGRRELKSHEIPYGITEGLKRDNITELETEIAALASQQIQLPHQIETLSKTDDSSQEIQTFSNEILKLVGNRLDILGDVKKLEQDVVRKRTDLSDFERKSLQLAALRRLNDGETFQEYIVSFVPAETTENLTSILQDHYLELTELEGKQRNLKSQKEKVERLIRFVEEEKDNVVKLVPLFHKQVEQLKNREEEEWAKIRIRFAPEKAEEILSQFEAKTGKRFSIPAPIAEEEKVNAIKAATPQLYENYIQLVAARNWISLFEQRLSPAPSGLIVEVGQYQEQVGELDARNSSFQRRVDFLLGHSVDQLPEPAPNEPPMTAAEKDRFLKGEISTLRAERLQIRSQTAIVVIAKLVGIIVIAFLMLMFINRVADKTIQREEEKEGGSAQNVLVYSLLKGIAKLLVWIFGIIASLHYIGFNVGAILAGLGIFGFAIAMASKELIANLIGGINILIAKPFQVGDYVVFNGTWVMIEKIGLQYTQLREFSTKFLLVTPNSKLSEGTVVNANNPDYRGYRHIMEFPLARRNSFEKVELAVKILEDVVNEYEHTTLNWARINKFDKDAIVLKMRCDMADVDYFKRDSSYLTSEILKRFKENGIEFTATGYYKLPPLDDNK